LIALDTHFWVWFHVGDPRLTESVSDRIGRDTVISAATVWEVMLLIEKGRLSSSFSPKETVFKWIADAPMRIVPVGTEIAVLSRTLEFTHNDPADRFIAATAYQAKAPLATIDTRLVGLSWLKTVS